MKKPSQILIAGLLLAIAGAAAAPARAKEEAATEKPVLRTWFLDACPTRPIERRPAFAPIVEAIVGLAIESLISAIGDALTEAAKVDNEGLATVSTSPGYLYRAIDSTSPPRSAGCVVVAIANSEPGASAWCRNGAFPAHYCTTGAGSPATALGRATPEGVPTLRGADAPKFYAEIELVRSSDRSASVPRLVAWYYPRPGIHGGKFARAKSERDVVLKINAKTPSGSVAVTPVVVHVSGPQPFASTLRTRYLDSCLATAPAPGTPGDTHKRAVLGCAEPAKEAAGKAARKAANDKLKAKLDADHAQQHLATPTDDEYAAYIEQRAAAIDQAVKEAVEASAASGFPSDREYESCTREAAKHCEAPGFDRDFGGALGAPWAAVTAVPDKWPVPRFGPFFPVNVETEVREIGKPNLFLQAFAKAFGAAKAPLTESAKDRILHSRIDAAETAAATASAAATEAYEKALVDGLAARSKFWGVCRGPLAGEAKAAALDEAYALAHRAVAKIRASAREANVSEQEVARALSSRQLDTFSTYTGSEASAVCT